MKLADLHCDTPFELFNKKLHIAENDLHISLEKADFLEKYVQVAAIWSCFEKDNNACYNDFFEIINYFKAQAGDMVCYNSSQLITSGKNAFVLAVEDARLLNGDIKRLYRLKDVGVKLMTLTWKDTSFIGGAWNTDMGLTDFGRECVSKMLKIGIIPDVSHGSVQLLQDVYKLSRKVGKPFCATHSNSFSICGHRRNLTDDNARLIAECGGIVGISLCSAHLSDDTATIDHILKHIDHYISHIGEDAVAFGCDFDGVSTLPCGINDITSIKHIFSACSRKYGERLCEKIFFNNVYNFLLNNI